MKFFILLLMTYTAVSAFNIAPDKLAFQAYKKGQYEKAFRLYKESTSIKAAYNLGQFYEQGIGTPKNWQQAKQYYEEVYSHIDLNSYKTCESEMLPYYYTTLKKLHKSADLHKLESLCKVDRNPFLHKCPSAKAIPMRYRSDIEDFQCFYYKKFPNAMKRLLQIHTEIKGSDVDLWDQLTQTYKQKIIHAIQPITRYYIQKESQCIQHAMYKKDIEGCLDAYKKFLWKAFISGEISVTIPAESREKYETAAAKERTRLATPASRDDKQKALQELRTLHQQIQSYHF